MEQEKQGSIQFRCRKISTPSAAKFVDPSLDPARKTMKDEGDQDSRKSLESPTPEKPESRIRAKGISSSILKGKQLFEDSHDEGDTIRSERMDLESTNNMVSSETSRPLLIISKDDESVDLPEMYKTLSVLFERMDSSIRLLSLRKKLLSFRNISTQVEILSKRKFLCTHLAQMKYAFPEAIQIEKVLVYDDKSLCIVPDLKITLVHDIVKCILDPNQSASAALCKAFHARLLDFYNTHPEGTEIPHAVMPEPFNQGDHEMTNMPPKKSSKELSQEISINLELLSNASHFPSSFHQQFTNKMIPERETIEPPAFPSPLLSKTTVDVDESIEVVKCPEPKDIQYYISSIKSPPGVIYTPSHVAPQNPEITPSKHSTTDTFSTETPLLQTPRRPVPTTDENVVSEDEKSITEPKSATSVRRSLIYSPSKGDESPDCLRKSTSRRSIFGAEIIGSLEGQGQVGSDAAAGISEDNYMSQSGQENNHNSLAFLLGMFDTICLILRSTDCSFITKQELVHKIILNNLDIEEPGEVEEQLQLLEELVPDWISKKAISNGDCFYSIKKAYDQGSVRARLVEAV